MGADEEGTHERLRAHLGELVEPKLKEHRGRIVKNTGDGFLAEFASVVDTVRCAVEFQRAMADRNAATPPEKRIEFRVGVNLGDVIAEEHDIFGDGVNVAARLDALAQPGGSASAGWCVIRSATGSITPSRISANSRSRTSRGQLVARRGRCGREWREPARTGDRSRHQRVQAHSRFAPIDIEKAAISIARACRMTSPIKKTRMIGGKSADHRFA
jgi:class 3 adenylate cyclase